MYNKKPINIFEEVARTFAPTNKIFNSIVSQDRILNSLHEEKSPEEIKEIAINWLSTDDLLKAIFRKLKLTEDQNKIKELEELVYGNK